MPNRIIRESLLDSSRYLSVDESARLLYTHLLLLADDFGCLSIEHSFIGRRCFPNRPDDERLNEIIEQLARVDLIRLYQHRGLHFAFIPRFRQRLKRETLKNPQPPADLLEDDNDAQEKFKKLNGHEQKGPPASGRQSAPEPPESRPPAASRARTHETKRSEVEVGSESIGSEVEVKTAPASDYRNAVDLAAQLAEKMRLKESSQDDKPKQ